MEIAQGSKAFLALIGPLFYSYLYMLGGRDVNALGIQARIWKRFIAPTVLIAFMLLIALICGTLNWWLFSLLIWYIPIGYGSDEFWLKFLRRTLSSLFFTLPCVLICVHTGKWPVAIFQVIVGLSSSLILGITNPNKAPEEELLNSFSNTFATGYALL